MSEIKFYNQGDEKRLAGSLEHQELEGFPVYVKPLPQYDGEFGFDWMRLGAETSDTENYQTISEDFPLLEKEYEILEIVKDKKYYVSWLCMFPNHSSIVGKDVELMIYPNINDIPDYINDDKDKIKLIPQNGKLEITPNELTMYDIYNSHKIKIKCNAPLSEQTSIEIRLFSSLFRGEDAEKGKLVGKINVLKNSDYEKYKINVRLMYSYLSDNVQFGVDSIKNDIQLLGGFSVLEEYLNKHSLNQALIQVKFVPDEKGNIIIEWPFRQSTLDKVSDGIDPQSGTRSDEYNKYKGLIMNKANMLVDGAKYMDYINFRFGERYSKYAKEHGICLYMTSLQDDDAGGMARVIPLNNKHCIIFKSNLSKKSSYAHEIGHTLGLYHTFLESDTSGNKIAIAEAINRMNISIDSRIQLIRTQKTEHFRRYAESYRYYPEKQTEANQFYNDEITKLNQQKNEYSFAMSRDNVKFSKNATLCVMDYSSARKYFSKHQWDIMQKEIIEFYNEK